MYIFLNKLLKYCVTDDVLVIQENSGSWRLLTRGYYTNVSSSYSKRSAASVLLIRQRTLSASVKS